LKIKKIVFITGTRADFGKLKPLIDVIEDSKLFECHIFATGMHTLKKYGNTYSEIKKLKYRNLSVYRNQKNDNQDLILAETIRGFSDFVRKINPDMIIVHGDRLETLAGAVVGLFNGVLVGHIEGGEISGTVDEIIRHSVTKLSHIHFVSNLDAKKRIVQMGENKNSSFIIGSPEIEVMKSSNIPNIKETKIRYNIPFENYAIFIFHPVVTEFHSIKKQINEVISGLKNSKKKFIIIYPNNDKGSDLIINEIKKLKVNKNFKIFPSLRFNYFLSLLKNADFVIGNSSTIVREAEVYGTPAINIGTRQNNRNKSKEIINIPCKKLKVVQAIKDVDGIRFKPKSFFYPVDSCSAEFLKILSESTIWNRNLQKQFKDIKI
jgi:UDP-N-acetylglucosamine 2-epimerase (hydrolysing)